MPKWYRVPKKIKSMVGNAWRGELPPPSAETEDIMWKKIEANPRYEVNEIGEVRNSETGHIRSLEIKKGYPALKIPVGGKEKTLLVHRLVAEAFIPNPDGLPCINHKDENKANNHVDNLEWCTVAYNNAYGVRQTMCDFHRGKAVVAYKDGKPQEIYWTMVEAAKAVGCNPTSIQDAVHGKNYTHTCKGYEWRFFHEDGKTNGAHRTR